MRALEISLFGGAARRERLFWGHRSSGPTLQHGPGVLRTQCITFVVMTYKEKRSNQ
ncbi:hypothetical protein J6590_016995 [Homalodisca vitripennis]|nr:hypothetical protein J6590_016995 [Homalodisca vitripennis]